MGQTGQSLHSMVPRSPLGRAGMVKCVCEGYFKLPESCRYRTGSSLWNCQDRQFYKGKQAWIQTWPWRYLALRLWTHCLASVCSAV